MYQPNAACLAFCNWMLNISPQKLSGPQRLIVEAVRDAAFNNTPVSDQTWWNFNLFTPWRNKYYRVFFEYATLTVPSLLSGLVAAYNFEGNSNDELGSHDAVDTDVAYDNAYGKIGQGVWYQLPSSKSIFPAFLLSTDWTVSLWVNPQAIPAPYGGVIGAVSGGSGIIILNPSLILDFYVGTDFNSTIPLNNAVWNHVILRCTAGVVEWRVNDVLDAGSGAASAAWSPNEFGNNTFGLQLGGYLDAVYFWNRALSDSECSALYNSGAGIQYPF